MKQGHIEDDISRFDKFKVMKQAFKDVTEGEIIFRVDSHDINKLLMSAVFNFRGFINSRLDQSAMIIEKIYVQGAAETEENVEDQKNTMIDRLCCQKKAPGVFNYNNHAAERDSIPERSIFFIRIDGLEDQSNPNANQIDQNNPPELLLRKMGLVLGSADFKQYVKTDAEIVDIKTVAI